MQGGVQGGVRLDASTKVGPSLIQGGVQGGVQLDASTKVGSSLMQGGVQGEVPFDAIRPESVVERVQHQM